MYHVGKIVTVNNLKYSWVNKIINIWTLIVFCGCSVHGLDPLVLFLSQLVEDEEVRRTVEGCSRLRLREDGLSLTTVPAVLSHLDSTTNTKLSRQELNEVSQHLRTLLFFYSFFLCTAHLVHQNPHGAGGKIKSDTEDQYLTEKQKYGGDWQKENMQKISDTVNVLKKYERASHILGRLNIS